MQFFCFVNKLVLSKLNMKNFITTILVFFFFVNCFSQVIKTDQGISISTFRNDLNILNEPLTTYFTSIGIDYWEKKNFYLSSNIGYLQKGGVEENPLLSSENNKIEESWKYLHLNSTIRYAFRLSNTVHFYLGAGPTVDFLIDSNNFNNEIYSDYKINTLTLGAKAEAGFVKDFNRFRTSFNFSYLYDLTNAGGTNFVDLINDSFQITLSLGYRIE